MEPDGGFEQIEPAVFLFDRGPFDFDILAKISGLEPVSVAADRQLGVRPELDGGVDDDTPALGRKRGHIGPPTRKVEPRRRGGPNQGRIRRRHAAKLSGSGRPRTSRGGQRTQLHTESISPGRKLVPQTAPMLLGNPSDDGQAQAPFSPDRPRVTNLEGCARVGTRGGHLESNYPLGRPRRQRHRAVIGSVPKGVLEQLKDGFPEQPIVTRKYDRHHLAELEMATEFGRTPPHQLSALQHQGVRLDLIGQRGRLAGASLGNEEQFLHPTPHLLGRQLDPTEDRGRIGGPLAERQ